MVGKINCRMIFIRAVLWAGILADIVNVFQYLLPEPMFLRPP
jgi:hypothetical protein